MLRKNLCHSTYPSYPFPVYTFFFAVNSSQIYRNEICICGRLLKCYSKICINRSHQAATALPQAKGVFTISLSLRLLPSHQVNDTVSESVS